MPQEVGWGVFRKCPVVFHLLPVNIPREQHLVGTYWFIALLLPLVRVSSLRALLSWASRCTPLVALNLPEDISALVGSSS